MRVLIACERSGIIRDAFAALGHDAWSCDLEPTERRGQHIQGDALKALRMGVWDLLISHPDCTHLCVSGALHFAKKRADGRQRRAKDFFMAMACVDYIPQICTENPVGIMSTVWRKPDQIVQPYEYGDDASKKTCLWLKGIAPLIALQDQYVAPRMVDGKPRWANQTDSGQNKLGPSEDRSAKRAQTYPGIARAMALQWGGVLETDLEF